MVFDPQADNTKLVLDTNGGLNYQFGMTDMSLKKPRKSKNNAKPNYLAAHRKAHGLDQYAMAERLKTSQAQVSRLENGERGVELDWLERYATALKIDQRDLLAPPQLKDTGVHQDERSTSEPVAIPETGTVGSLPNAELLPDPAKSSSRRYIFELGSAAGGKEGKFILNAGNGVRVLAPPSVEAATNPYLVRVYGTSMENRYFEGERLIVNPDVPYGRGSFVVAQLFTDEEHSYECYVKKFISFNSKELVLEQLNPPKGHDAIMRFPASRVRAIHKIVGALDG